MTTSQTPMCGRGRVVEESLVGLVLIDMEEDSNVGAGFLPARGWLLRVTGRLKTYPTSGQRLSHLAESMIRVVSAAITSPSVPATVSTRSCLSWIINRLRIED